MTINPQAQSLVNLEVQRAALTKADMEKAKEEQQRALELEQMLSRLEVHRITPDKELPERIWSKNGKTRKMLYSGRRRKLWPFV